MQSPVNSMVCKSMMFSNVIVDIKAYHSFVFSQSYVEVLASLSDVRGF